MFKTTKSKLIFVVIFSIICISITICLIIYKNIDIKDGNEKTLGDIEENIKKKDVQGIDLDGTYDQNDIKCEQRKYSKEKTEVEYCQISGLKNQTIQDKINKEIEHVALNCYKEKVPSLDEVVNIAVNVWNTGNFANTMSFSVQYYAKISDDSEEFYQGTKGLNYDLNTGEKITIDKIFTSDAPIENILRKSAYYSLLQDKTEDNLNGELVIRDYGEIEDEVVEFINLYKRGKLSEFYYTPRYIEIFYGENKNVTIDMKEFSEYIAIYNRYLTSSNLYEENNIGFKNLYTLSNRYADSYYYSNYQKENNYFIDISVNFQEESENEFSKKLLKDKKKEIENVKTLATKNSNNFYILNYYMSVYTGQDWEIKQRMTDYYERGNSYEMTKHDFEENIEPIIIKYSRELEDSGGIPDNVYDFSETLKIEPQETKEYYNPETGEKLVI